MIFLYNIVVHLAWFLLQPIALINKKINLFVKGRKEVFNTLSSKIKKGDKIIWVHAASLGEYEQGLPIIESLKKIFPDYKVLITFFSPSGYEVKKNSNVGEIITYLPLDTKRNAAKFLSITKPILAVFIKYEIWPNYLSELKKQNVPTYLISSIFNKRQVYFKWYGGLMRKALKSISHCFVQDEESVQLLKSLGFFNVTLSGDTRFDRVSEIVERNNQLTFMHEFKGNQLCFVAGSTWPEGEKPITSFINTNKKKLKYVIAPHNIKKDHIASLKKSISKPTLLYSKLHAQNLNDYEVLIIDTIGLLTKIYSYADIAYVGGGFGTGLHNTLEPAVFGIPVLIGPEYEGFIEAEELVTRGGLLVCKNTQSFNHKLNKLINQPDFRKEIGQINSHFIETKKGATAKINGYLKKELN